MTVATFTVTVDDTAQALGSGDVPVLGTPRLLAWMEQATVLAAAPHLAPGGTTVGVQVELTHSRASRVGTRVHVEVIEIEVGERQLILHVVAREESPAAASPGGTVPGQPGAEIGRARVVRARVDRERFLARLADDRS